MDLFTEQKRKTLRPYQEEAVEKIMDAFGESEKPLLIMATGTGKTIVFSEVHRRFLSLKKRSLVIAHRGELLSQAQDKIFMQTGYTGNIEKAQEVASKDDLLVIASIQTMQGKRLEGWPAKHFSLVTVDEAHHVPADSYQALIKRLDADNLLGVTATPDRADEKAMGNTFTKIAYEYPLHRAIKEGNLVPIIGRRVVDFDINLSGLKVVAGDYSEADLARIVETFLSPMAHSIKEQTEDRKTLVFMPNVESSRLMCEALSTLGLKAGFISGQSKDRANTLYQFSVGNLTHLISCNVLLEGYDEPSVEAIVMARPTASRTLYAQAVGRGTRIHPGKENLLLVEFTYNSSKLKLVSAFELFSTMGFGERVRDHAEKTAKEKTSDYDFLSELEKANMEMFNIKNLITNLPIRQYGFISFDPIVMGDLLGIDLTKEFEITYQGRKLEGPMTQKQRDLLVRYNIANLDTLDKAQASALIGSLTAHDFIPMIGPASSAQMQYLRSLGYPIRVPEGGMTKAQAAMMISFCKQG